MHSNGNCPAPSPCVCPCVITRAVLVHELPVFAVALTACKYALSIYQGRDSIPRQHGRLYIQFCAAGASQMTGKTCAPQADCTTAIQPAAGGQPVAIQPAAGGLPVAKQPAAVWPASGYRNCESCQCSYMQYSLTIAVRGGNLWKFSHNKDAQ
jgi:hypothetical protein